MRKNKRVFIIGGGATASIVKLFYPDAKIIAPSGKTFLPVHHLWKTPESLRFIEEFGFDKCRRSRILKIDKNLSIEELNLYNKITHKPANNKPSEGAKEIEVLDVSIPQFPIDIYETVIELKNDRIITDDSEYEYDLVFVCSPLVFKPMNYRTKYYPIRVYRCSSGGYTPGWDYAYLGGKLLEENIYRVSSEGSILSFEQAGRELKDGEDFKKFVFDTIGIDVNWLETYVNKFAHFDIPKEFTKDREKIIFASRLSILDHEFLLSDLIKKLYEGIENGIF